jgi:hypothetical protein
MGGGAPEEQAASEGAKTMDLVAFEDDYRAIILRSVGRRSD